jgi:hypothetical protein
MLMAASLEPTQNPAAKAGVSCATFSFYRVCSRWPLATIFARLICKDAVSPDMIFARPKVL